MVGLLALAVSVAGAEDSGVVISPLRSLSGHDNVISGVAALPDGIVRSPHPGTRPSALGQSTPASASACSRAHTDWVTAVAVTPDGRCAVSASDDGTLKVWDIETGACLRTLVGHTGAVTSVAVTPEGRRAVSGSWDKT